MCVHFKFIDFIFGFVWFLFWAEICKRPKDCRRTKKIQECKNAEPMTATATTMMLAAGKVKRARNCNSRVASLNRWKTKRYTKPNRCFFLHRLPPILCICNILRLKFNSISYFGTVCGLSQNVRVIEKSHVQSERERKRERERVRLANVR